jgi:ribosomal protein L40E
MTYIIPQGSNRRRSTMYVCKLCGAKNERPWFEAVYLPLRPFDAYQGDTPAEPNPAYAVWACRQCRRYHLRDGTLYEKPCA